MKKLVWCGAALVGALASSNAAAQPYIGIAGGVSHGDFQCATYSCDKNGPTLKLLGGYEFASGWAAEIGYLGFETGDLFFEQFSNRVVMLDAAYRLKLSTNWSAMARLGAARVSTDHEVWLGTPRTTRGNVVSPYGGLGLVYAFGKTFAFELAGDFTQGEVDDHKAGISSVTAGVRITF
jgi:hypothetical protein